MSIIAIIPARGGSKRIPNKNILDFCGNPIIKYSIDAALSCGLFDEIMVSTDSQKIADIASQFGASAPFLRSNKNADDHATTADVLIEVLSQYKEQGKNFDYACCIYPAAPLITGDMLKRSHKLLLENSADSIVPVVPFPSSIERALAITDKNQLRPKESEFLSTRTQDLNEYFYDAGQFYWLNIEAFFKHNKLIMPNSKPFILPETNVQDIDTGMDLDLAKQKYQFTHNKKLKICFMGGNQAGMIGALTILAKGHEITYAAAYTEEIRRLFEDLKIPTTNDINDENFINSLSECDLLISVHGRQIVKQNLLKMPKLYSINVHPCLSKYKRANPVKRSLDDQEFNASVGAHIMTESIDQGEIIDEFFIDTDGSTSVEEIYNKLYPLYAQILLTILEKAENEIR